MGFEDMNFERVLLLMMKGLVLNVLHPLFWREGLFAILNFRSLFSSQTEYTFNIFITFEAYLVIKRNNPL
ncbi:hypothetical protein PGA7_00004770 [Porphyromonas gingivalis]|nr:hypothetical protein PGA7_00004770 [Porphyromonas gingivalis]